MIDPKKLFDTFLGNQGTAGGAGAQPGTAQGASGLPGGLGDLKGMLSSLAGGAGRGGTGTGGLPGGMGHLAAGSLIGMLLGSKQGRKLGGSMLGYGGAAILGSLAFKAWQDRQAQRPPTPATAQAGDEGAAPALPTPPRGSGFDLEESPAAAADGIDARLAVVRAMIAAAKADGHIDATEQRALFDRIGQLELDSEAKAFVMDELSKPLDVDEIAGLPANQEQASEIWLASRLAIDPDDPREQQYLETLARRMNLPARLVAHLDAQVTAL